MRNCEGTLRIVYKEGSGSLAENQEGEARETGDSGINHELVASLSQDTTLKGKVRIPDTDSPYLKPQGKQWGKHPSIHPSASLLLHLQLSTCAFGTHYLPCTQFLARSKTPSAERTNMGTWDGSRNGNITERAKTCLLGNPLRPEIHRTRAPHVLSTFARHCPGRGSRARLRMAAMALLARERPGDYPEPTQTARLDCSYIRTTYGTLPPPLRRCGVAASRRRPLSPLSPGDTWEERNLTTWDGWDKTGESHLGMQELCSCALHPTGVLLWLNGRQTLTQLHWDRDPFPC
ncbi:hypothetical protein BDP55DRAFT_625554 [Colletotrichum godetiae]|uniref:Uncharacterized protein n=1 Tax=Colletotrichum godetiae TaxID=1209918 RepID=A0AAJ0B289_9PEZI|nr:uncharacterized protein BDP55DRAFT_625554 [Colletotrichum godetiae]KAK1701316.1 hypothetical protein BDP55DRAFT_625554 [Colletotrichum godetiae]